jgi:hypothetical protein
MIFFEISIGFHKAHYESGYEEGKAKSNSLLYVYRHRQSKLANI